MSVNDTATPSRKVGELTPDEIVRGGVVAEHEMASLAARATKEHLAPAREDVAAVKRSAQTLREVLNEYQAAASEVGEIIAALRTKRMTLTSEVAALLPALRDVRQFFIERDYEKEMARLHEFLEVCERLKALKESGFLDDVADTLLKLSTEKE